MPDTQISSSPSYINFSKWYSIIYSCKAIMLKSNYKNIYSNDQLVRSEVDLAPEKGQAVQLPPEKIKVAIKSKLHCRPHGSSITCNSKRKSMVRDRWILNNKMQYFVLLSCWSYSRLVPYVTCARSELHAPGLLFFGPDQGLDKGICHSLCAHDGRGTRRHRGLGEAPPTDAYLGQMLAFTNPCTWDCG